MSIKKVLLSSLMSGALVISSFASVAFAQDVQISGNGSSSSNTANVTDTSSNTAVQTNTATIMNNVSTSTNSGGNSADGNTGGNVSISTGTSSSLVDIANTVNLNKLDMMGEDPGDSSLQVSITGNGSNSNNDANVNSANTNEMFQTNTADISNAVSIDSTSGDNSADNNTNGHISLASGDSLSRVTINNMANANVASGEGVGAVLTALSPGSSGAEIANNGSWSDNDLSLAITHSTLLTQTNTADIGNDVYVYTDSGNNTADDNTGGNVALLTGDALARVSIGNLANFNGASLDNEFLADPLMKISGNGTNSSNDLNASMTGENSAFQTNTFTPQNNIEEAMASSGNNDASNNTGTGSSMSRITTGDSAFMTSVRNSGNVNTLGNGLGEMTLPGGLNFSFSFDLNGLTSFFHSI